MHISFSTSSVMFGSLVSPMFFLFHHFFSNLIPFCLSFWLLVSTFLFSVSSHFSSCLFSVCSLECLVYSLFVLVVFLLFFSSSTGYNLFPCFSFPFFSDLVSSAITFWCFRHCWFCFPHSFNSTFASLSVSLWFAVLYVFIFA